MDSTRKRQESLLNDIFLQPWFLDKRCAAAIARMVPDTFRDKMRFYFDDWGCLICKTKTRRYGSNGMCQICVRRIQKRLLLCLRKRAGKSSIPSPTKKPAVEVERVASARILLRDLVKQEWSPNRMKLRIISR
jgi:hypothetical protein